MCWNSSRNFIVPFGYFCPSQTFHLSLQDILELRQLSCGMSFVIGLGILFVCFLLPILFWLPCLTPSIAAQPHSCGKAKIALDTFNQTRKTYFQGYRNWGERPELSVLHSPEKKDWEVLICWTGGIIGHVHTWLYPKENELLISLWQKGLFWLGRKVLAYVSLLLYQRTRDLERGALTFLMTTFQRDGS